MAVIMAAALLGSLINIPVARRPAKVRQITAPVTVSGVTYRVPLAVQTGRTLAGGFAAMMTQTAMTFCFGTAADARVPNLGASGAIAATLRAYFVLYPGSRKEKQAIVHRPSRGARPSPAGMSVIPRWHFPLRRCPANWTAKGGPSRHSYQHPNSRRSHDIWPVQAGAFGPGRPHRRHTT
jgi:hypothetical protein